LRAFPKLENASLILIQGVCIEAMTNFSIIHQFDSGPEKRFQDSAMRAIDPPIKLAPDGCFPGENRNFFDFCFNTPTPFPESGSKKRFQDSGMFAIDSPHKNSPRKSFFSRKSKNFRFNIHTLIPVQGRVFKRWKCNVLWFFHA
jgi:hypothetical protein